MDNQLRFEDLPQMVEDLSTRVTALDASIKDLNTYIKNNPDDSDEFLGMDDVCRILGLSKPTLYRKVSNGEIKSYKPVGSKLRKFKKKDLLEWMERNGGDGKSSEERLKEMRSAVRHKPRSIR